MKKYVLLTVLTSMCTAAVYTGCMTNIKPIEPIRRVVTWVPDDPAYASRLMQTGEVAESGLRCSLLTTAEPFPAVVTTLHGINQTHGAICCDAVGGDKFIDDQQYRRCIRISLD